VTAGRKDTGVEEMVVSFTGIRISGLR